MSNLYITPWIGSMLKFAMFKLLENVIVKKMKVGIFLHAPPEKTIPQVLSITHSGTGRGKLTIPR